jgi:ubiquinone/menaquinone biosynthesis C-methylase UbiE
MIDVDWKEYSEVYDLMATVNPAYQEILTKFDDFLEEADLGAGGLFADLGAGTGNFSVRAVRHVPGLRVLHVDADPGMNARALLKAPKSLLEIHSEDLSQLDMETRSLAGAVCVHALYTLDRPHDFLRKLNRWLAPGARVFLCDLGRELDLSDWRNYVVTNLVATEGWVKALKTLYKGREVIRQNRNIVRQQQSGRYWTHSHDEFLKAVKESGLKPLQTETVYRGYSDLVIAEKGEVP